MRTLPAAPTTQSCVHTKLLLNQGHLSIKNRQLGLNDAIDGPNGVSYREVPLYTFTQQPTYTCKGTPVRACSVAPHVLFVYRDSYNYFQNQTYQLCVILCSTVEWQCTVEPLCTRHHCGPAVCPLQRGVPISEVVLYTVQCSGDSRQCPHQRGGLHSRCPLKRGSTI